MSVGRLQSLLLSSKRHRPKKQISTQCNNYTHFISKCQNFKKIDWLSVDILSYWILEMKKINNTGAHRRKKTKHIEIWWAGQHTSIFALPKSHNLTWCERGSTWRTNIMKSGPAVTTTFTKEFRLLMYIQQQHINIPIYFEASNLCGKLREQCGYKPTPWRSTCPPQVYISRWMNEWIREVFNSPESWRHTWYI